MPASDRQRERFQDERYGVFVHWGPIAGHGKAGHLDRETHDDIAAGLEDLARNRDFAGWPDAMERQHAILRRWLREFCTRYHPAGIWFDAWPCSRYACENAGLNPLEVFDFESLTGAIREAAPDVLILNKERVCGEIDVLTSEYLFQDHFGGSLDGTDRPVETCDTLPGREARSDRRSAIGYPGGLFGGVHRSGRHDHRY
jgi:hypothetical protein